jgi:hypothetical protein
MNNHFAILSLFILIALNLTITGSQISTVHTGEKSTSSFVFSGKHRISKAETTDFVIYMAEAYENCFIFYTIDKKTNTTKSGYELWIGLTKYLGILKNNSFTALQTMYENSSSQKSPYAC